MKLYPSISNSSKAPRKECLVFVKEDGTNFSAKWTHKQSFDTFGIGKKGQLVSEETPFWSRAVKVFKNKYSEILDGYFRQSKDYRNFREITVFGEFFGPNSFAGRHVDEENQDIKIFDILVGHKNHKFLLPQDFLKEFSPIIPTPDFIYRGNLTDALIQEVRQGSLNGHELNEGVICKGIERSGAYMGGVWMCKIKTQKYFDKLKEKFGEESIKYWE